MSVQLNGKPTFGAGRVFMTGNYATPTPARALVPQSQDIDFKRKTEALFGENQFPVFVGAGEMNVTGKVDYSASNARILADMLFGVTGTAGSYLEADKELGAVGATPYHITVVNSATWIEDLGVIAADTGVVMTRVAPGAEVQDVSYSVAAGVYTFAALDTAENFLISYVYSQTPAGETLTMTNQLQGLTGNFQAVHVLPWGATQDMFVFYECIASDQSFKMKQSGFATQSFAYEAFTNDLDVLGVATFSQAA